MSKPKWNRDGELVQDPARSQAGSGGSVEEGWVETMTGRLLNLLRRQRRWQRRFRPSRESVETAARRYADWAAQAAVERMIRAFEQLSGEPAPIPLLQGRERGFRNCACVSFRDGAEFERSGKLELR